MEKDTTPSGSKPGSRFFRLTRLRAKRPAPTSSSSESATCATTSALRKRRCVPPTTASASCFSVVRTDGLAVRSAGSKPKTRPVKTETPSVKPRSRRSGSPDSTLRACSEGKSAIKPEPVQVARTIPRRPPPSASTRLSTRSWRTTRNRLAPSATRIATSRWRLAPRARIRLATLAHAISSTRPTIPISK